LLEEPISPQNEIGAYIAERSFPEPIALEQDILRTVACLARQLSLMLERRGEGARKLELALFRADGALFTVGLDTSRAMRDAETLAALFAERLDVLNDELDPGFGYDLVRLSVLVAEQSDPTQADLGRAGDAAELARLVDHVGARLGLSSVTRLHSFQSHLPERTSLFVPIDRADLDVSSWDETGSAASMRPLRLLARPEEVATIAALPDGPPTLFRWRCALHEIRRVEGPERIADEWWRSDGPTRDYYRVEDKEGRRFWLFREGLFERETSKPRWFLHGFFA
jgi:protein ImuB